MARDMTKTQAAAIRADAIAIASLPEFRARREACRKLVAEMRRRYPAANFSRLFFLAGAVGDPANAIAGTPA